MPATRNNYQLQADNRTPHMTVADLLKSLEGMPQDLPVVFLSPRYGCFGSEQPHSIGTVEETVMPRMENVIPACTYVYDETGETVRNEEETQVWPEWRGVVIQGR